MGMDKQILPGTKQAYKNLGRVLVLGLGVSGRAALEYLVPLVGSRVESLTVFVGEAEPSPDFDLFEGVEVAEEAAAAAADVQVIWGEGVSGEYDLCVASPGISEFSALYGSARAASGEVIGEVEFAWRESPAEARWVAITGTNGKTTTTALTEAVLRASGIFACACGNIGDACITAVARAAAGVGRCSGGVCFCGAPVFVAEVSSYQLASTVDFAPDVACVLNITPDHLHWHRSHENYAAAKWKVLANLDQVEGAVAVLNACDDEVRAKVRELKAAGAARGFAYIPLGTADGVGGDMRAKCGAENAAFVDGAGVLRVCVGGRDEALCRVADMHLKGAHNVENALAAASCAVALGADAECVGAAVAEFDALEHRIEPAGVVDGVEYFNDSKATNTDATLKAIAAFEPARPIILLGGRDKGTDLADLVEACVEHAKGVVLFGEAHDRFAAAFEGAEVQVMHAVNMAGAIEVARRNAVPGDIVVLSPACASFDEFSCFEERGDVFKQIVSRMA